MHMKHLAELNLGKNNIKFVNAECLMNSRLSSLDLSENKIIRIHEKSFNFLSSLKKLYLQDNKLQEVPSKVFQSFDKLEILNIGQNSFTVIDDSAFPSLG